MTQAQNLANLSQDYGVIPMSNRNLLIDGALDQWSALSAVPLTVGSSYAGTVAWRSLCGNGGAGTLQIGGGGGSGLGQSPYNYAVWTQSTASTGSPSGSTAPGFYQTVENVATANGKSLTFSCTLQLASGGPVTIPLIICRQYFGSGGSPSTLVNADRAVNWVVSTTIKRFSVRLDVPSVANMNRGTDGKDGLQIGFWLPPGVTFVLSMQQFQLELSNPLSSSDINGNGGEPTAFEYRGPGPELARVQRYYQFLQSVMINGNTNSAAGFYGQQGLPVTMRGTPACSIGSTAYQNASGVGYNNSGPNFVRLSALITTAGYGWAMADCTLDARI